MQPLSKAILIGLLVWSALLFHAAAALAAYPLTFTDSRGETIVLKTKPRQVVSLVPSITEMIFKVGAGEAVAAVTLHNSWPPAAAEKPVVGGFFSPNVEKIASFQPDVIFVATLQKAVIAHFRDAPVQLICLEPRSLSDSFETIYQIGNIFGKAAAADALVKQIRVELALIKTKTGRIPAAKRLRVMRLMGRGKVMTPGSDSFQNEMIRAAGGIPPDFGEPGNVVEVFLPQWQQFNPQVIYGCGGDRETAAEFFSQPGWKEVDAIRNSRIFYFPCGLTCRTATQTGTFVSWLASRIYSQEFADPSGQVHPDGVYRSRPLELDLPYIRSARIAYSRMYDFTNKSLIVDLKTPLRVVSTLEGQRENTRTVGNHYSPPPVWSISHEMGLEASRARIYRVLGHKAAETAFLFTGADMDNLSIQQRNFKEMTVYALVTAGVRSNAVRMSRDTGNYYEPGTINILLLTNRRLTPRAMTRAIISATEAKTAALMDMDVRSSYLPRHRATGTGTDNVLVVEGAGGSIDNTGGHSKMGELIASAVYGGVQEAVYRQNGLAAPRSIFRRLKERRISIYGLVAGAVCDCGLEPSELGAAAEALLLQPTYAGFMASALALSDAYQQGLIADLSAFRKWAHDIAEGIADRPIAALKPIISSDTLPAVEQTALNAIFNGIYYRNL